MLCPRCRHEVRASARFCEDCGAALWEEDPFFRMAEALRLESEGRLQEAVDAYERLVGSSLKGKDRAAVLKHLGNLHFRIGHLRRAATHLEAACEADPSSAILHHDLGLVRYHMGEFDAAIDSFHEAVDRDVDLQLAHFWLGNALYHRGDLEAAIAAFRELLDRYPNFTVAHFHLGVIFARQGRKREAEEEFRRVLRVNPEDAAARFYVETSPV